MPFFLISSYYIWNLFISTLFQLEYGCLLPSLPSDATYDNTSGVSFICDLNDNIAAPWPSASSEHVSFCNKSMPKLLYFTFGYWILVFLCIDFCFPWFILLPPHLFSVIFLSVWPFLDLIGLQLPNFQLFPRQHRPRKVVALYNFVKANQICLIFFFRDRPYISSPSFI